MRLFFRGWHGSRERALYEDDKTTTKNDVAQRGGHTPNTPANTKSYSLGLPRTSSLILDIHVEVNWHLSKQYIRWPVSRDHIVGASLELIEVTCFLRWPLTNHWVSVGSRAYDILDFSYCPLSRVLHVTLANLQKFGCKSVFLHVCTFAVCHVVPLIYSLWRVVRLM